MSNNPFNRLAMTFDSLSVELVTTEFRANPAGHDEFHLLYRIHGGVMQAQKVYENHQPGKRIVAAGKELTVIHAEAWVDYARMCHEMRVRAVDLAAALAKIAAPKPIEAKNEHGEVVATITPAKPKSLAPLFAKPGRRIIK